MTHLWTALCLFPMSSAETPRCSEVSSAVCQFLDMHNDQKFIRLADGTRGYNTLYQEGGATDEPTTTGAFGPKISDEKLLAKAAQLLDVRTLSPEARAVLTDRGLDIFNETPGAFEVPTPLSAPRAKRVLRPRREIAAEVKAALGPKKFDAYRDFVNRNKAQLERLAEPRRQTAEFLTNLDRETEDLAADPKLWAAREARARQMFEDAKKLQIQVIGAGRPREAWTPEQQNMVGRIETLGLKIMSAQETADEKLCQINGLPNAFNVREFHRVELCRQILVQTDGALAFQVSHEIGHSNDPCALQNDFARVDHDRLVEFKKQPSLSAEDREVIGDFEGFDYLGSAQFERLADSDLYARLVAAGAIRVLAPRINGLPRFYRDIYGCVARKFNLRTPDPSNLEKRSTEKEKALAAYSGLSPAERGARLKRYRNYLSGRRDCAGPKGEVGSQMMEATADLFGTIYQEKFLTEHPPRGEAERALALFLAAQSCGETVDRGHYPEPRKRLSMQLDSPGMARLFDCTRDESGCFDHLTLRAGGASSPQPAEATR